MVQKTKRTIAIIGGGSWATALVKILSINQHKLHWWMRDKEAMQFIKKYHRNPNYLSAVELNIKRGMLSHNLRTVIKKSDIIVVAIPSAYVKDVFKGLSSKLFEQKLMVSAIKGMIPDENLIMGEYLHKSCNVPLENIIIISGPCHAEEVAQEKLSYLTISCTDEINGKIAASLFNCRFIKTTISDDIYGTEYAAVIKNIIAIASGICNGLGYGDNFQAVLISNAIQEVNRFVDGVHPIKRDIMDSAYLGDLLVTAYSQFSRNRTFGNMIGKGYSVSSAQMEMSMIAEGYYAVKSIHEINKQYKLDIPISEAVYKILYERANPLLEMRLLREKLS